MSEVKLVEEILSQMNINHSGLLDMISRYLKGNRELDKNTFYENDILIKIDETRFHFTNIEVNNENILILSKLNKIVFEKCSLNINEWDYNNLEVVFFYCDFINDIVIRNINILDNIENFLFVDCKFKRKVELKSTLVNSNLFKNCYVFHLYARDTEFKQKIFDYSFDYRFKNFDLLKNESFIFYNCSIHQEIKIGSFKELNVIHLLYCDFLSDFILESLKIKNFTINRCKFINSFNIQLCHINMADFTDTLFKSTFLSQFSSYKEKLLLENIEFENNASFLSNEFNFDFMPISCNFNKGVSFKDSIIKGIDLEKSNLLGKSNFNNIINLNEESISGEEVLNRETARIIKDSFEQQNNIIEANKYYAIEMQKMEEELKKADKVKISEWLIFKIHGLTSNHSQDWLLALFWILSLSFGLAFINCINEYLDTKLEYMLIDTLVYSIVIILSVFIVQKEKINNFYLIGLFYLIYGFTTKDFTLYNIVNNINPFSIMTEFSELTFLTLVYKVTIAYLIYQLIVSIRQNTRRK